jgi:Flp pilus assembly protein TadD, contains TPR repeats
MSSSGAEAQALALFRAGRLEEAEHAWQSILERTPEDPQALHMLGYILVRRGQRAQGLAFIDRSIERAPRAAPFLNNRAQLLAEDGRIEDAVRDLRRAVQLDPKFARASRTSASCCSDWSVAKRRSRHFAARQRWNPGIRSRCTTPACCCSSRAISTVPRRRCAASCSSSRPTRWR